MSAALIVLCLANDTVDVLIPRHDLDLERGPTEIENKYRLKRNENKANLRDLIAATGLVNLLKLDSNHRFFSPRDLEI